MCKSLRPILTILAVFLTANLWAQSVKWSSTVEPLEGDSYRIVLEAAIPVPYHMYDMGPYEGGPNATVITFTPSEGMVLEGEVEQLTAPHR